MRKLAIFALLSLIAHWAIVADLSLPVFRQPAEPPPLRVRLQAAPALPPVLPRARPPATQTTTPPAYPATPLTAASTAVPAPPSTPAVVADSAPPAIAEAALPVPPATATAVDTKPAPALARRLPRKGEISYELYLGSNRFNVGHTVQSWTLNDDSYRVRSASETTGIAAMFARQSIEYISSGRLTAAGLRPDQFSNARERRGEKDAATARFDWKTQTITFGEPPKSAPLAGNEQDLVSFMYQLGLMPLTPGRIMLPITNGWKFERYELEVGIEEILQTPFGELRAVPVRQLRRANEESIELWLAPAYRWLPVRIRFFDREGQPSGEQLVSDIRVSEE
jgi:hypothetical protein